MTHPHAPSPTSATSSGIPSAGGMAPPVPLTGRPMPTLIASEPSLLGTLGIAAAGTIASYAILRGFPGTTLTTLLAERGWTQHVTVFLSLVVVTFIGRKLRRLTALRRAMATPAFPSRLPTQPGEADLLADLVTSLVRSEEEVGRRVGRVLLVFGQTRSRAAAADQATEDAMAAQARMETSYTIPRILIWAIPLLGFIGTVIGISAAVQGFDGFLQTAQEVDQIKDGIGMVTRGLAVAFDTTLVALAASILVMIPLTFIERAEARAALTLETLVQDRVVAQLPPDPMGPGLSAERLTSLLPALTASVADGVHRGLTSEGPVAELGRIIAREASRAAGEAIRTQLEQEREAIAAQLTVVAATLREGAAALAERVDALGAQAEGLRELGHLQSQLDRTLAAWASTGELQTTLAAVRAELGALRPALDRLAQPRRLMVVEAPDGPTPPPSPDAQG